MAQTYLPYKGNLYKYIAFFILLFLAFAQVAGAQTQNIALQGVVRDGATHQPLTGATVRLKGTTHEVVTNDRGVFGFSTGQRFPVTFIVSFVGFRTTEATLQQQGTIEIDLQAATTQLNDVVVVGYGTQRKSDLTGSIASISESQFKRTPVASLDNALRGRASGVLVTSTSNQPGGATSIRVRGNNSVNTGSEPLYVIDGFPVYNDNSASSAGAAAGPRLNALALINPNDIVSVEILKDASATAIYGSRGANGVVLITTKKGQEGATKIDVNAYYGQQKVAKKLALLNATEFAQLVNEANGTTVYTPQQIAAFGKGTDWQDEVFRTAPVQNYQVTASGGDAQSKYALSLNYFDQQGIVINSGFQRYAARFNFEKKATDRLTFGTSVTLSRSDANVVLSATGGGEGTIGVVGSALAFSPILPVRNPDGTYVLENDRGIPMGNPVATANELTNKTAAYRTLGNIFADFRIANGLTFRTSIGADVLQQKEKYYAPRTTLAGYTVQGTGRVGSVASLSWLNENTLTYLRTFKKHSLTALAGVSEQKFTREAQTSGASGFVNDLLGADNLASGAIISTPSTNTASWSLLSYIGRVNYGYANKYLLTLTGRVDGSSKFGANNKYGYFPSGSVAWKLSEEDFVKQLGLFHELKLRGSYGRTGNQEINSYQSLASLSNMSYVIGDNIVKGFAPSNIPNQDLKWETTSQADVGLDASFFRGRLNVTLDRYYKKTTDMLLWVNVPWSTGFASALQNIGSVENKGVELGVQATVVDRPFKWNTSFNIAANRNKVLSLGPVTQILTGEINGYLKISDPIVIEPGQPISSFFGYRSAGIFQNKEEVAKSAQPTAQPGDRRYVDVNGDGKLDATDRTFIGHADPKFFGGMTHDISYKNFDLALSFNWVSGNTILNSTRAELDLPTGQKNSAARVKDRWTPANPTATIPRASLNRSFLFSDALLEDGSYFRLGTATLAYNLPETWLRAARFRHAKVYVSATNLFTLTPYSGYDPEANQSGQNNILRGIDSDSYPSAKTIQFGVNLGL
ncbi:TonB-dependent receptor [Paraflavisolibacter sp. H34]|uniref:SusC/RagA family TonB-linked outer membrane protein n=1 Tax=Huijunlia imazamoxiresistens TaxID=3127457 RepID=UPI00301754B2